MNKNLLKILCKLTIDTYPKICYNKGIEKEREVHKMPQEILRIYNEDQMPIGYLPIEKETMCQMICSLYGFTYKKEKIS